jgi:hypothetical protein
MQRPFKDVLDELAPAAAVALIDRANRARQFADSTTGPSRKLLNCFARRAFIKALTVMEVEVSYSQRETEAA